MRQISLLSFILQVKKLGLIEVKQLAQGHTADK